MKDFIAFSKQLKEDKQTALLKEDLSTPIATGLLGFLFPILALQSDYFDKSSVIRETGFIRRLILAIRALPIVDKLKSDIQVVTFMKDRSNFDVYGKMKPDAKEVFSDMIDNKINEKEAEELVNTISKIKREFDREFLSIKSKLRGVDTPALATESIELYESAASNMAITMALIGWMFPLLSSGNTFFDKIGKFNEIGTLKSTINQIRTSDVVKRLEADVDVKTFMTNRSNFTSIGKLKPESKLTLSNLMSNKLNDSDKTVLHSIMMKIRNEINKEFSAGTKEIKSLQA